MKSYLMALTALAIALPAMAHDVAKGPNGGTIADAGSYHVELVTKGTVIEAFISDQNDKALSPVGFKGLALIVVDGKAQRVPLEPQGVRLTGTAQVRLPASPKGAVQLTAPDGKTSSASFK